MAVHSHRSSTPECCRSSSNNDHPRVNLYPSFHPTHVDTRSSFELHDAVLSSIGFSAIIDYASSSIPVQTKPGDSLDMNVRLEQRESTQTNSKTMHNKKENVQKQQQQQQQQRKKQQKRQESRPNSPQSSELYKNVESQISQLKTVYQSSLNNPDEIISAIRYTDYLKYRDATIHHGGMYQMETIETY